MYTGIDPSITNTGMVLLDKSGNLKLAVNGKNARERGDKGILWYVKQAEYLAEQIPSEAAIVYEDYAYHAIHRMADLAEYGGILKANLMKWNPKFIKLAAPAIIKSFATGSGQAVKSEMQAQAAKEEPKLENASEDICDAYFMAKMAFYMDNPNAAAERDKGNPLLRHRLEIALRRNNYGKTC